MIESKSKILCIEDDEDTCHLLTFLFKDAGCKVETCSRIDCLKLIHEENFSAIILDNYFDGLRGVEICQKIRSFDQKIPIIFFSGESRTTEVKSALEAGANDYLVKGNDFDKLLPTVIKLIEQSETLT